MRPRTRRVGRRDEPPHAPPGPPRRIRPAGPALASMGIVAVLAAGCAGCGADTATPGDPPPSTPASSAPTATDPPATAAPTTTTTAAISGDEAEVRATIDRYWAAYLDAVGSPDAEHAELTAILFGEAQTRILGGIGKLKTDGLAVVAPEASVFSHSIITVSFGEDGVALVDECVVDDLQKIKVTTGEVVDGAVVTSRFKRSLLETEAGWRITTSEQVDRREGVQPCDVFS